MEDKQLNINQPLLSVRRFSSIAASQKNENRKQESYLPTRPSTESPKTEFKWDPMRNTGSVPFVWEHSPGRPKDETNKKIQTKEIPPSLPKLPPGRVLKPKKKDLDNITKDTHVTKGPTIDNSSIPTEEKITKFESAKSTKKENSDSRDDDDDDDNDEAFMDALDTLSRGESSFYNCSASGVSGFESDVKPSGILSKDPKMCDFMMGRFLPAAKAMASEVPQYTSRKQVIKEKPRELKKLVNMDNKKLQLRYGPPAFLQDVVDHDNEEEEDSDYDYDEHEHTSSKICGLFPRFSIRSGSFGPVNPVPRMSMRTQLQMSPANRTHPSSSSVSSFSETENEPARIAIYEHRSFDRSHLTKHQEDKNISKGESIESTNQNDSLNLEGLQLYNRLQVRGLLATPSESFQCERNNLSSQKKSLTKFKELLADKNRNETDSQDFMVEKTLYVDTVHTVKSPKANSIPSSIKGAYDTDTPKVLNESCKSLESDKHADEPQDDMKIETHTGSRKDPEVENMNGDQDLKASQDGVFELPGPPPLPKSPSDSWLWRTLPSVSSKQAPIRWNPKYRPSNTLDSDSKSDKNIRGTLLPIPET